MGNHKDSNGDAAGDTLEGVVNEGADATMDIEAVGSTEAGDLEVRWMVSGRTVCSLPAAAKLLVSDIKERIREQTGVPIAEQRLFTAGAELPGDALAQSTDESALMLVRSVSDPRVTNLGHFRASTKFDPLPAGAFTVVRRLAKGINGDVFMYRWSRENVDECVAVKKLKRDRLEQILGTETDERCVHLESRRNAPEAEDALTEIGVLSYLAKQPDLPVYLLRMLRAFSDDQFVWLVTEFADGGELFEVAASGRVAEAAVRRYTWQLLQALAYLHQHHIGHRDVSLENVLLKDGVIRVMDFGMAVRSHSASGAPLRYFRAVGKDNYRAPECYVPPAAEVTVVAPATSAPRDVVMTKARSGHLCEVRLPADVVPGQACKAEVWGYSVPPADIFSSGVCLFVLSYQCPLWHRATLADPYFDYVHSRGDTGLQGLLKSWNKPLPPSDAMTLLRGMLNPDPSQRPSAAECLGSPWFSALSNAPIPVHEQPSLAEVANLPAIPISPAAPGGA